MRQRRLKRGKICWMGCCRSPGQPASVGFSAIFHHIMRKEFIEFSPSWPACTLKLETLSPSEKNQVFWKGQSWLISLTAKYWPIIRLIPWGKHTWIIWYFYVVCEEYQTFRCNMKSFFLRAWLFWPGLFKIRNFVGDSCFVFPPLLS